MRKIHVALKNPLPPSSHHLTMLMLHGGKSQRGVAKSYTTYKTVQLYHITKEHLK